MTDHHLQSALDVIAAAENGTYDTQLGISPDERALLTKAQGDDQITVADIKALTAIHRHDLIASAHEAGRINLDTTTRES